MNNIIVYLRDDYVKKNGESSVYLRLYVAGKRVNFPTGVSVSDNQWDNVSRRIKKSHPDAEDNNLVIAQCVSRVNRILVRYNLMERQITSKQLKEEFDNPASYTDFMEWMEGEINSRKKELDPETIKLHFTVFNSLKEFRKDILFADIDEKFLEKYDSFMRIRQSNNITTRNKKLRVLKSYLNRALRRKVILYNPFQNVPIKKGNTRLVYLTREEIAEIVKLYKMESVMPHLRQVMKYFLFACFTGLRISDVKKLSWDMILDNVVHNHQKKGRTTSNKVTYIPLSKQACALIGSDLAPHRHGLVFDTYTDQRTNKYLKDAMTLCKIKKHVSFHVARHTFATLFLEETNDLATLQQLLGHSSITQTMIYAHVTEKKKQEQIKRFGEALPKI